MARFHATYDYQRVVEVDSKHPFIQVNGSPTDEFLPKKGLRQGDPLAPFLFLIIAEVLNGVVKNALLLNKLTGFKIDGDHTLETAIIQFADDTLFVCEASFQNVVAVKCILRCFELASGLKVNFNKSCCGGIAVDNVVLKSYVKALNCREMRL